MDITTARERLKEVAAEHFKDNTFTHYINYMLAGDFAVEVATLLDSTLASLTSAESRGRAQGLREAAEACRAEQVDAESTGCPTDKAYNHACDDCADAILSLIPSLTAEKGEERCEWVAWRPEPHPDKFPGHYTQACRKEGTDLLGYGGNVKKFCPYCGKPITIK